MRPTNQTNSTPRRPARRLALALSATAGLTLLGATIGGCDRDPAVPEPILQSERPGAGTSAVKAPAKTPARERVAAVPSLPAGGSAAPGEPSASSGVAGPAGPAPEVVPPLGPPASFFVIDREPARFPPARVSIKPAGDGAFDVRLFSDDPPEAMEAGYRGDSFYFEMRVVTPPGGTVADGEWSVQPATAGIVTPKDNAADGEGSDAPEGAEVGRAGREVVGLAGGKPDADASGLFLDGRRRILVPVDAAAVFDPVTADGTPDPALLSDAGRVRVRLVGTFRQWVEGEPSDAGPRLVEVSATLSASRGR